MYSSSRIFRRQIVAVALGSALMIGGTSLSLAAMGPDMDHEHEGPMHCEAPVHEKLDAMANRLEIKASQQNAWQAYAKAVEAMADHPRKHPAEDADATTIAKFHADMAAEMASKLKKVSDATAKLEAALAPEQRKTLDQAAREFGQHGHHMHGEEHGEHEHAHEHDHHHPDGNEPGAAPEAPKPAAP